MLGSIKILTSRVLNSKDGKVLASNFGFLMLLQIAGYVFPLITIPYLARVIGVDGFGKVAFAAAVIVWFRTIAEWGFNYTATRDVARNRDDLDKVSEIFSNVLWARVFLMFISLVILLIAISAIPYFKENQTILLVTFLLVPGHILFPDWFFQAMERMKYITIFDLLSKALFTALVFVLIKEESDFILQPLFVSLGYVLSGTIAMYIIVVKWKVKIHPPKPKIVFSTIRNSTDVFVNNIMPNLYNSLSTVLLGFMGGSVSNGLLDAGSKFVAVAQQFMTVLSRVFFPFLSRKIDKHAMYAKLSLIVAAFSSLCLFIAAPLIIKLFFTEEFYSAIIVLKIMSLSIVFITMINVYGVNYMILKGREKELKNITFFCSVLGLFFSIPLIYNFDYIGAAVTITLTRAILGLTIAYKAMLIKKSYEKI